MRSKTNKSYLSYIALALALALAVGAAAFVGLVDYNTPGKVVLFSGERLRDTALVTYSQPDSVAASSQTASGGPVNTATVEAKLLGILPLKEVKVETYPQMSLIPGGMPFGVKMYCNGVLVVGFGDVDTQDGTKSPGLEAGLRLGDVIESINGEKVSTIEQAGRIIEQAKDQKLTFQARRDDKVFEVTITPVLSLTEKKFKTGVWLRDSTAGIGTISFINPRTGAFAGLGHGICDVDTGKLMPLGKGICVNTTITGATKGKPEHPGELHGEFKENCGRLLANTASGVFGLLDNYEKTAGGHKPIEVALSKQVKLGKATIYSTVDQNTAEEYTIEIIKIYKTDTGVKNFLVKITDPELLEKTGGIVQGMSGSPILQDGKLIGAVTHVLINDPTCGYGIFIENMLANMPDLLR